MLRVIRKDLILNRNVILVNSVIFVACLTYFATAATRIPPQLFAGFASFMMAFLPAVIVTREDKFNAMTLGCSLPVSRKAIVQARFALSVGMALLSILVAFLLGSFVPYSNFRASDLFSPGPLLIAVAGITIVLSLLLPFTLRFGMKGILIFLVATQVLGVVLLTVVKVTGSSMDKAIVGRIIGFFVRAHEVLGSTGFNLSLAASLLSLLGLSYLVSVRVFERREL